MRSSISFQHVAGALAALGTSAFMAACGGSDTPPANSPVQANEVISAPTTPAAPTTTDAPKAADTAPRDTVHECGGRRLPGDGQPTGDHPRGCDPRPGHDYGRRQAEVGDRAQGSCTEGRGGEKAGSGELRRRHLLGGREKESSLNGRKTHAREDVRLWT